MRLNIEIYYKLVGKVNHVSKGIEKKQSQPASEKVPAGSKIPIRGVLTENNLVKKPVRAVGRTEGSLRNGGKYSSAGKNGRKPWCFLTLKES